MKLIALSDTHGRHREIHDIPDGDVLVYAGDAELWTLTETVRFNNWLKELPHKHKIVIGGNHDRWLAQATKEMKKDILSNCIYLENESVTIDGIKFYGSPVTPMFCDWFFMKERGKEIAQVWKTIPKDTDVIITHGPCQGILDRAPRGCWFDNVGCEDLKKRIFKIKPICHIFGHIHYDFGYEEHNKIGFYNVSMLNEMYQVENKPREIIIQK